VTKLAKVDKDDIFGSSTDDIFSRGSRKSKGLDEVFATEAKPTVKEVKSEEVVREEPKREDVGERSWGDLAGRRWTLHNLSLRQRRFVGVCYHRKCVAIGSVL